MNDLKEVYTLITAAAERTTIAREAAEAQQRREQEAEQERDKKALRAAIGSFLGEPFAAVCSVYSDDDADSVVRVYAHLFYHEATFRIWRIGYQWFVQDAAATLPHYSVSEHEMHVQRNVAADSFLAAIKAQYDKLYPPKITKVTIDVVAVLKAARTSVASAHQFLALDSLSNPQSAVEDLEAALGRLRILIDALEQDEAQS